MRIHIRIPMPWKMLQRHDNPFIHHSPHVSQSLTGYVLLILTEGAEVDHGIAGIVIDVNYRREIDIKPQAFEIFGNLPSHLVNQCFVLHRTQGHLIRKGDRKSTRLNSSHVKISYAVFCLKKKKLILTISLRRKHS